MTECMFPSSSREPRLHSKIERPDSWYYYNGIGQQLGPFEFEQLEMYVNSGTLPQGICAFRHAKCRFFVLHLALFLLRMTGHCHLCVAQAALQGMENARKETSNKRSSDFARPRAAAQRRLKNSSPLAP